MAHRTTRLSLSLSGPDPAAIAQGLVNAGLFPGGPPERLEVDGAKRAAKGDWLPPALTRAKTSVEASYDDGTSLSVSRRGLVRLERAEVEIRDPGLLETLAPLPFELAVVGRLYDQWVLDEVPKFGFGDGHVALGWACGFKGAGHRRLVSPRWLEFGPWKMIPAGKELTWVQFHELEADADTALAQAAPGWERMGISDVGGFIQTGFVYTDDVGGVYEAAERRLKVVAAAEGPTPRKMLELAAARVDPRIQTQRPFDRTGFVFVDAAEGRAKLHECWLYEHEVLVIEEEGEVRIDAKYAPTPTPPAWARRR